MPKYKSIEIKWDEVEVGKQYRYEEKYDCQAEVTVVSKTVAYTDSSLYVQYELKVDKAYQGCSDGDTLSCGKSMDKRYSYLSAGQQFKTLDSWFSYMTPGYNPLLKEE